MSGGERRGPGRRRSGVVAVILVAVLGALGSGVGWAPPALATGESGASSRVTPDGRIVTAVWGGVGRRTGGGPGGGTRRGVVTWYTLTPVDLAFLVQVAAGRPDLADAPLLVELDRVLAGGVGPESDLQVELLDGVVTGRVRAVPAAAPQGTAAALRRSMITRLPTLRPTITPPPGAPALIDEPVFVSFPDDEWDRTVATRLDAFGVSALVRARPVAVLVMSGDPADVGTMSGCGPGVPFDPDDPTPARRQARRPGACTITYRTATGVEGRRDRWYGALIVSWRAEWSADGGTSWADLGIIPRVGFLSRQVRTADTVIEDG